MRKAISFFIVTAITWLWLADTGCAKEYSYEGQDTTSIPQDTIRVSPPEFPFCSACQNMDVFEENRWSFKIGTSFLCGIIDTAIVAPERTGFTFFGPSACSSDSGMIIDAFIGPDTLNHNLSNVISKRASFYYYENVTPQYLLMSRSASQFTVTINSYDHSSRMAVGEFNGFVYRPNGSGAAVFSGKFKVKLK